ncbi:AEC family transporter [Massilia sp. PAMC28688]|uniref:AEC family transporter n=1 Tax=Massilia sp. PAMC28688 TaxID=2861283 RepID=UPI001C62EF52|nr:AEC family transporter [Massilia sp. PAMC28688]QYF95937.1 AEC family transporter [Massilia sp. PAMC28688]
MTAIVAITFPFFALVLAGYIAVRRGWLPQLAIPGLNTFVLFFGLPCLLYRFSAGTPVSQLFAPALFSLYLACALVTVGLAVAVARLRGMDWNNAAFGALVAAFPNTGFMGVPLLAALLGSRASAPLIAALMVDLVLTSSLCIALSRRGHGRHGQGSLAAAGQALGAVVRNPLPWGIFLGAAASGLGLTLIAPMMTTVNMLADAASPVALFTIGAVLARAQAQAGLAGSGWSAAAPGTVIKLVVHPALIYTLGYLAMGAGLPLDDAAWSALVLVAALPSANNVAMLAERYGADTGHVARITLATTVLSFLSFSAAVALLR